MEIELTEAAKKDLSDWKKSGNTKVLKRIRELLASITETPFEGIGKPEPLKYQMSGLWSYDGARMRLSLQHGFLCRHSF